MNIPLHKEHIPVPVILGVFVVCMVILTSFVAYFQYSFFEPLDESSTQIQNFPYDTEMFSGAIVEAKAYVVYDIVNKKVIAGRNEEEVFPLASLTKVMTAVTALTHHSTSTPITITRKSIDGGYDLGLQEGQVWPLEELVKYTLIFSSNDGAQAIAEDLGGHDTFVANMNSDSALLGLELSFTEPSGLDKNGLLGGKGTALAMAKLFAHARKEFPGALESTSKVRGTFTASTGKVIGIPNTNQEIETISGSEASKTGYTDEAGGNLAIIADVTVGHPIVIVVLGSTKEARFSDVAALYAIAQSALRSFK